MRISATLFFHWAAKWRCFREVLEGVQPCGLHPHGRGSGGFARVVCHGLRREGRKGLVAWCWVPFEHQTRPIGHSSSWFYCLDPWGFQYGLYCRPLTNLELGAWGTLYFQLLTTCFGPKAEGRQGVATTTGSRWLGVRRIGRFVERQVGAELTCCYHVHGLN